MRWTWRLTSLPINQHISDCPLSFSCMGLVIACICVCLWLLEKGLYCHPCLQAQWGTTQDVPVPWRLWNKYLLSDCLHSVTQKGGYAPYMSLLVLTHEILTTTLWGRGYPCTLSTNERLQRWNKLLKVTCFKVSGWATSVKWEWTSDLDIADDFSFESNYSSSADNSFKCFYCMRLTCVLPGANYFILSCILEILLWKSSNIQRSREKGINSHMCITLVYGNLPY